MSADLQKQDLRIGTMLPARDAPRIIPQIKMHGFESFELTFGPDVVDLDLAELAGRIEEAIGNDDIAISCLGIYGNPLGDGEVDAAFRNGWAALIDGAHLFGAPIVSGFTGRLKDRPIPESLPRFKEVFAPLAARAADKGLRLAFENCDMGGDWATGEWNIAHNPAAWEMMFNEIPDEHVGLEWEPCHQMVHLIDPMAQLRKWVGKVFHVHGKDATVMWDVVREFGIAGPRPFAYHRTPGFGDSNWSNIISELRLGGFRGSIDIEGWHDPVWRDALETTGQVHALHYLKQARGGYFVPNPE